MADPYPNADRSDYDGGVAIRVIDDPAANAPAGLDERPGAACRRRMLLIRTPSMMYNFSGIPPFGLATIAAELRARGYDLAQDDLDARCAVSGLFPRHRWGKQFPEKALLMDIERMRRFWATGEDEEVVDLVRRILGHTDIAGRDTILLSCVTGDDIAAILTLCIGKHLKAHEARTVILGGEAYPHMVPIRSEVASFHAAGCFDYYIQGYGETPLLELLLALDEGRPIDRVQGLIHPRPDGTLIENAPVFLRPEVVPDFDGLPMSLYDKLPDEWGNRPPEDEGIEKILVLPVKLNFNCPMDCAFCISSGDAFAKVTAMSPDAAAHAVKHLKERYGTPYFMFANDLYNVSRKRAVDMAEAFLRHQCDIMWSDCAYGRALRREDLQLFRRAGACRFIWGLESGSERMQKYFHKGIRFDEFEDIVRWSHEAGIYNAIEMIAGMPTESEEDVEASIAILHRLRPYIDQVYLNPFSLITGSQMHKTPETYRITNVRPVATVFQKRPDQVYSWIQRYTFDEIGGLPWSDKIKQIEDSYRRVHQTILDLNLGGHDLQTLFHRFTKYGDKRHVTDFQSSRRHQAWDYFDRDGQRGHSPVVDPEG